MKKESELRQLFKNRFDCYAVADDVIMAMTEDMFIKILPEALDLAAVVKAEGEPLPYDRAKDIKECATCKVLGYLCAEHEV